MRGNTVGSTAGERIGARTGLSHRRQVLLIVALASLPLIGLVLAGIWLGMVRAEAEVARERLGLARAGAQTTSAFVGGSLATARSLARTRSMIERGRTQSIQQLVDQIQAENPDWEGWGLAGPDGRNIVSAGAAPGTLNVGDRPYFQRALQTGRAVVSPAVLNRRTQSPTVVIAAPVDFDNGERGAIIVSLSTARLSTALGALRQDSSIRISVVDSEGTLFVHPDPALAAQLPSLRGRPAVEAALAGLEGSRHDTTSDGSEVVEAYGPVADVGWGVLVTQPTDDAFEVVHRQTLIGFAVLALAVAVAGAIGWYLGGRLTEIYRQQQAAMARAEATAERLAVVSAESERSRRFFEGVIASAPIAIAVLRGQDSRYEAVNARFQALKPDTPMLGRTVGEVFPELDEWASPALLERVNTTGEPFAAADRPWPATDGAEPRYFTYVLARLDDDAGKPDAILSVVLETTDAVVARQRAAREKDEFLSIASHELKTPLTALSMAAQLVERQMENPPLDEERLRRHVGTIRSQATRTTRLINDLLDMSRIDAGRLALTSAPVDLVTLVEAATQRQRDALPEGAGERLMVCAGQPSITVHGDSARLEQVLTNLLTNAVKYSPDGSPIEVGLTGDASSATIRVVDHGIGVPEAERADIFVPFQRASTAIAAHIQGTGLGLYITRRIVEAHGGTIHLDETPGGGTTVVVTLPMQQQPDSP
jgi:signal transduction histidine kinase